ncbi:MAG: hypothetical protein QGG36_12875 [Pirellulaceae bacterium]|nr:hypothetical protein [Pirellulaceae bacterium]MDP7016691.1 hypothetical protein [Pirellulaceae bacterium]
MQPVNDEADAFARSRGWACAEVFLLLLLFFVFAGWPPPDANEAHYLCKAKNYWNPEWCAEDLFLSSSDAHVVFYWTFGWLTLFAPLGAVAWIGRLLTWTLLAWTWRRLSVSLAPRPFVSLVTAAIMMTCLERLHLAGEWIIGGVEAKGFAYALVFLALEAIVRGAWRHVWWLLGVATAFHVLVGGWSVVAAAFAWVAVGRRESPLREQLAPLAIGGAVALLGVVPALALSGHSEPAARTAAHWVYVYERLSHHLVIHRFPHAFMARHLALLFVWLAVALAMRGEERIRRLHAFVAGAVLIAALGVVIDQSSLTNLEFAASLLRFYWYRLSDAMLPIGFALGAVALLLQWAQSPTVRVSRSARAGMLLLAAVASGNILAAHVRGRTDLRPRGVKLPLAQTPLTAEQSSDRFRDWRNVCGWIKQNTPGEAVFLTPRRQQTFKWYAERAEVVNWKDVPQDADTLLEWRRRVRVVYPRKVILRGFGAWSDDRIAAIANRFGATYVVDDAQRSRRLLNFPRVYPTGGEQNGTFRVYYIAPVILRPTVQPK